MSFTRAQAAYVQLRRRLSGYVSADALPDVTADPPKRADDELAFIRLVAWSYIVIHEVGKLAIGVLRHLPPLRDRKGGLLPHVRALRTWTSHNLSFDSKSDLATIRLASAWFHATCGTGVPSTDVHWKTCFSVLAEEMAVLLEDASAACDVFESPTDSQAVKDEFKKRLERNWEAFRFDEFVDAAAKRLGYEVDIVHLRNVHLKAWREVVEASAADAITLNLTKRIEADLLNLMANAAPLSTFQVSELLGTTSIDVLRGLLTTLRRGSPEERRLLADHVTALSQSDGARPL